MSVKMKTIIKFIINAFVKKILHVIQCYSMDVWNGVLNNCRIQSCKFVNTWDKMETVSYDVNNSMKQWWI